mgnify:CR=1 FL=1
MYQVVALTEASAEPTETLNSLSVGMVCVRNLQVPATSGIVKGSQTQIGRYTGRWCYGHALWTEYPEIGECICICGVYSIRICGVYSICICGVYVA